MNMSFVKEEEKKEEEEECLKIALRNSYVNETLGILIFLPQLLRAGGQSSLLPSDLPYARIEVKLVRGRKWSWNLYTSFCLAGISTPDISITSRAL